MAQMMGHSSAGILQTYAKAADEQRREAIRKLEASCLSHVLKEANRTESGQDRVN